jgi:hypothetical protein
LFIQQTHAVDYSARIPTIYGKKLWILTNAENTPIQEIQTIKDDWELDISSTEDTSGYIAHLSDVSMIEWTANNSPLQYLDNIAKTWWSITKSCKQLLEKIPSIKWKDWAYMIDPSWLSPELIHCDMTTNGWGRTYATMLADGTTKNLFNTWNTEKITSITNNISTKWSISSVWKENVYKDIMIVCQITTSSLMSYETPLFIYQYWYWDIINLEKQNKQWSIFSSKDLDWSWGNYNFTYNSSYWWSAEETTLYLYANWPTPNVVFNSYNWTAVLKTPSGDAQWPANNSVNLSQPFSSTNYCMTAIR